jgi:hypothetical protein
MTPSQKIHTMMAAAGAAMHEINAGTDPIDPAAVARAYARLKRHIGFSDVAIADVAREAGIELETFKTWLRAECRAGRAVLSTGDWSLSSDATRAGSINSRGRRYLLVRFK